MSADLLRHITHIYLLGAGGIGMSALGLYFRGLGKHLYGYDKTPGAITDHLMKQGAHIHFEDDPSGIPKDFLEAASEHRLVIYTPAIPTDSPLLTYFKNHGFAMAKRSEVLGWIAQKSFNISIAGTHGKSTTTALIAHVLKVAGLNPTTFVGAVVAGWESNFLAGDENLTVTEADEYDRSFLHLKPSLAILTSAEPDHLDIYKNEEGVKEGYTQFLEGLRRPGYLIISESAFTQLGLDEHRLPSDITISRYGTSEHVPFRITSDGQKFFQIKEEIASTTLPLPMPGRHNALNAAAAALAARSLNISDELIAKALASFPGLHRRLEKIFETPTLLYFDDYAHHPTELEACIEALRAQAGEKQVTGIFQPHLFTRTRDFAEGFARALEKLDTVILMPIYPAREKPVPGVDSANLFNLIQHQAKYLASHDEVIPLLEKLRPRGVLATMGAGDIDRLVPVIKNWMQTHLKQNSA